MKDVTHNTRCKKRIDYKQLNDTGVENTRSASDESGTTSGSESDDFANALCSVCDGNHFCPVEKPNNVPQDMIMCDKCDKTFHFRCSVVPIFNLPRGDWHCFSCQCRDAEKQRGRRKATEPSAALTPTQLALKTKLMLSEMKQFRQIVGRDWSNLVRAQDVERTFTNAKNIPKHSTELSNAKSKIKKYRKKILEKLVSLQTFIKSNVHKEPRADDEASEISTSDMTCSFCQHSTSSDDNDVYLCDYAGCGRMMHRECFKGDRSLIDAGEEEDWFCPYCNTLIDTLMYLEERYNEQNSTSLEFGSIEEVETALVSNDDNSDEDDDDSDSEFSSSESKEGDADSDGDGGDNNSDVDEDDNELLHELDRNEIAHLRRDMTEAECNIFESDDPVARSLKEDANKVKDLGAFSDTNIVLGKRRRNAVDYHSLNEALFGGHTNLIDLDDEDDYHHCSNPNGNKVDEMKTKDETKNGHNGNRLRRRKTQAGE